MSWIILIHQIPAKPSYFRAKIGRRLNKLGAVPIKQAVYVMPDLDQSREDLGWIAQEIISSGGEAIVLQADFLDGLNDPQVTALFQNARNADYQKLCSQTREFKDRMAQSPSLPDNLSEFKTGLAKLNKAFAAVSAVDFFPTGEQERLGRSLKELAVDLDRLENKEHAPLPLAGQNDLAGKIWVTRADVYVDRMASAWLIQRFIDPAAQFQFTPHNHHPPADHEIRFDMREAEFTHQGNRCTFEVLVEQFCASDPGMVQLAKIIHDIDLKDDAYGLPETAGIKAFFDSIAHTNKDDFERIHKAGTMLDGLRIHFAGPS